MEHKWARLSKRQSEVTEASGENDSCQQREETEEQQELHSSSKLAEQEDDLRFEGLDDWRRSSTPPPHHTQSIRFSAACYELFGKCLHSTLRISVSPPDHPHCRRISHSLFILISSNERDSTLAAVPGHTIILICPPHSQLTHVLQRKLLLMWEKK